MNILGMLSDLEVEYEIDSKSEFAKIKCLVHADKNPSASINLITGAMKCFSCQAKLTAEEVYSKLKGSKFVSQTADEFNTKYGDGGSARTIDIGAIEAFHSALVGKPGIVKPCQAMLDELAKRAVHMPIVRRFRLGYTASEKRIYIPVKSGSTYTAARKYRPGAKVSKMISEKGYTCGSLYPADQLSHDTILVCGGEIKALAAIGLFTKHGANIGAVSGLKGEMAWDKAYSNSLRGKHVILCYDIDEAGRVGVTKVAEALKPLVATIKVLDLADDDLVKRLTIASTPKGDLNDYLVGIESSSSDEAAFIAYITGLDEWTNACPAVEADLPIKDGSMRDARDNDVAGQGHRIDVKVEAVASSLGQIVKEVKVACNKDNGEKCILCPAMNTSVFAIDLGHPLIMEVIDGKQGQRYLKGQVEELFGIYPRCSKWKPVELKKRTIIRAIVADAAEGSSRVQLDMVADEKDFDTSAIYQTVEAKLRRSESGAATLVCSKVTPGEGALNGYTVKHPKDLKRFRPSMDTKLGIQERLHDIYDDLSNNVTKIYGRNVLHLVCDLVYHSPLEYMYRGAVTKGWMDVLVIGDSAQGKSEVANKLRQYYGQGTIIDCCSASRAGIVAGVDNRDSGSFISWGAMVINDRKMCILEEAKALQPYQIQEMTQVRSSGKATLTKIKAGEADARTRLLWISNPRHKKRGGVSQGVSMREFQYGVEAISEFMGSPECVRRLDLALCVSAEDVDVNSMPINDVEHRFTQPLCQDLLLWVWNLKPEDVVFECEEWIERRATQLAKKYSPRIPLLEPNSAKHKIARMAAALAARLYSEEDGKLLVKNVHVDYIVGVVEEIYSDWVFGYARYTEDETEFRRFTPTDYLDSSLAGCENPKTLLSVFHNCKGSITRDQLEVVIGPSVDFFLKELTRTAAIKTQDRGYSVEADFLRYLDSTKVKELML